MRPAWRLAINNLSERRSRTVLLVTTVALSAGLIVAVACAMASLHQGIGMRVSATVGAADLRLQHVGKRSFDAGLVEKIAAWPEVSLAVGRAQAPITLKDPRTGAGVVSVGYGIMPDREFMLRPMDLAAGRAVRADGEVTLDTATAEELKSQAGDVLEVERFGEPMTLTVVGIAKRPAMGMLANPECFVTMGTMDRLTGQPGKVREIDVLLKPGQDAEAVEKAHKGDFEQGLLLRVTAKITSGLNKNLESSQIGLVIASVMSFLSASFIIMTGLTTNVNERQRELAILRCIGGTRAQLREAQLIVGAIVGGLGALLGVPLGVVGSAIVVHLFPEQLPGGFALSRSGIVLALTGSVVSGVLGAAWPAWRASRTSPLAALAVRAVPPRKIGIFLTLVCGLVGVTIHLLILSLPSNGQIVFWGDVLCGMPLMFTGYFLLGVPGTVLLVLLAEPLISRLMRLPRGLLGRTVLATPYRHGFTAGAMMVGLALLVAIWTNGRAIMRDWLGALDFPDAFVNGINLTEQTQRKIEQVPGVTNTCAITLQSLETDAFGITALQKYNTTFVAFEPDKFLSLTKITWVQGDRETARRRLNEGGAVLVAKEFMVTKGLGAGDTITLRFQGKPYVFQIVGVVASPGLDIVSKFFDIGDEYLQQSVNAVFGSRADLKQKFGNDAINLIQISIDPRADDKQVIAAVRKTVGFGIISAGSGREIKAEIARFLGGTLLIFSVVAVASMLVACFGVANLIIAGIQARQFEFGVLRAIGGHRGLLARLVMGEAVIIALTACVLGTIMGTQASWGGQRLYQVLLGLDLSLRIPIGPTAAGWAVLTAITLGAAGPAVWRLAQRNPRELLGAMKG